MSGNGSSSIRSQFVASGEYSGTNFLLDSLSIMGADTRRGFDTQTAEKVAAMSGYVAGNPQGTNAQKFNEYVAKITPAAQEAKPAATARVTTKLGSGM